LAACIQHIDKRKGRAKVKMHFLGQERVIDLGINVLTHIS
ncbi:MAG TPA: transcription antiterminator, partial [Clostridiales bacterium]|nr:transcription antiterminator [Clostridiales bacterium]